MTSDKITCKITSRNQKDSQGRTDSVYKDLLFLEYYRPSFHEFRISKQPQQGQQDKMSKNSFLGKPANEKKKSCEYVRIVFNLVYRWTNSERRVREWEVPTLGWRSF